jgi:signal peptidase I
MSRIVGSVGLVTVLVAVVWMAPAVAGGDSGHTRIYTMPSESMEPAFSAGERVVVDLDAYDSTAPQIGDAVVFHPPRGSRAEECGVPIQRGQPCRLPTPKLSAQLFLKRVVATPGDRLSVRMGRPVVNGATVLADLIQACRYGACNLKRSIAIPADHYFVMGDNSAASADSRFWGPVPSRAIVGKVVGAEAG